LSFFPFAQCYLGWEDVVWIPYGVPLWSYSDVTEGLVWCVV
jgi:hypothetical protein